VILPNLPAARTLKAVGDERKILPFYVWPFGVVLARSWRGVRRVDLWLDQATLASGGLQEIGRWARRPAG
jgi:hypothetical protein